jgi:DNA-binding MarR family transcriptional regulator
MRMYEKLLILSIEYLSYKKKRKNIRNTLIYMNIKELALWIIDTDRRLISLNAFIENKALHPSDIAKKSGRSIQNISRALHELEKKELVQSIDDKTTWKKYLLTRKGEKTLDEVDKILTKGL